MILFIIYSIWKFFGVKTAFTPNLINFFSSSGGIIPPTTIGISLILFFFTDPFKGFEANANFYLLHGILIAAGTCFLAIGPRYISSPEASLLILLETILAPLLVWAVLYEYPGNWSLLGGALIVLTLLVFNFSAFSKTKQAAYKETP